MKRTLLIVLLSLGAVAGFSAGFARLYFGYPGWGRHGGPYGHGPWTERRAAFERHVAALCTEAAADVLAKKAQAPSKP